MLIKLSIFYWFLLFLYFVLFAIIWFVIFPFIIFMLEILINMILILIPFLRHPVLKLNIVLTILYFIAAWLEKIVKKP